MLRRFSHGEGRRVHFLERMSQFRIVKDDQPLSESGRVAGVKSGVPLTVGIAEADDDYVCGGNQGVGTKGIYLAALVIAPEGTLLRTEYVDTAAVTGAVVGDGGVEGDR